MRRRRFLKIAGGGIALAPWLQQAFAAEDGSATTEGVLGKSTDADIRSLFEANNEGVLALAEAVFRKCILEKLRPPVEPLQHTWIQPGGPYYNGQWIWDTMFVVDLLSLLPGQEHVSRDIFQNYWGFQDRWNKEKPAYAHDMVTVAIKTAPQEVRQFSQIPILDWGVERVYLRNHDEELLVPRRRSECRDRPDRRHRLRRPQYIWRSNPNADSRQTRSFGLALQQLPHDGTLLSDENGTQDRSESSHRQHGLDHGDHHGIPRQHGAGSEQRCTIGRNAPTERLPGKKESPQAWNPGVGVTPTNIRALLQQIDSTLQLLPEETG